MMSNKNELVPLIITPLQSCPLAQPMCSLEEYLQKSFWSTFVKNHSFRVNQIVQHKADAAVNNKELCKLSPNLDQ